MDKVQYGLNQVVPSLASLLSLRGLDKAASFVFKEESSTLL